MALSVIYPTPNFGGVTSGANFTLTPPNSNALVDDLVIVVVAQRSNSDLVTKIADTAGGTLTFTKLLWNGTGTTTSSLSIWYRKLVSGDPGVGNTNTWTVTNTAIAEATILCYRGQDTTTPFDVQETPNGSTSSSSSATFDSIATITDSAFYLGCFCMNQSAAELNLKTGGTGTATPTIRANNGNGGATSSRQAVGVIEATITPLGASGTFIYSLNASNTWGTIAVAIRPGVTVVIPTGLASWLSLGISQPINFNTNMSV